MADRNTHRHRQHRLGRPRSNLVQSQNSAAIFPPVTATSGCELFCTGVNTSPASVPPPCNGSTLPTGMATLGGLTSNTLSGLQQLLQFSNGVQLVQIREHRPDEWK